MQHGFNHFREKHKAVPWMILEALLGNVVVGNYKLHEADKLALLVEIELERSQQNVGGDGI